MSCNKPMIGIPIGLTENGKPKFKIVKHADIQEYERIKAMEPEAVMIPCGRCIDCRLDYSRHWADRLMLELDSQKSAIFLTLTYDDNHVPVASYKPVVTDKMLPSRPNEYLEDDGFLYVPDTMTLYKRDIQLFMKRLRKEFAGRTLRFFCSGEYGDRTKRPHYHMILYGISVDDFKTCQKGVLCRMPQCRCSDDQWKRCRSQMIKLPCGKNELGDQYFTSPMLEKIWKNGNVLFSDVSWQTCAYVARYVTKKQYGTNAIVYASNNQSPEFCLMSRNKGIGRKYFDEHPDCLDTVSINLSTPDGGREIEIPKYFLRIKDLQDPGSCDKLKEIRKQAAEDNARIRLSQTTLKEKEMLLARERIKTKSAMSLPRNKV